MFEFNFITGSVSFSPAGGFSFFSDGGGTTEPVEINIPGAGSRSASPGFITFPTGETGSGRIGFEGGNFVINVPGFSAFF
jgi:hypothetical protein